MVITLFKTTVLCFIIGLAAGLPVRNNGQIGFSGFINPFLAPVTKAQQYIRNFGNVFAPMTPSPRITESVVIYPETEVVRTRPVTHTMATSTAASTISNKNNEISSSTKIEENVKIEKEILDKIFKDFRETDQNSITTNDYSSTVDYPTGTYEYETTTDYLLRIPAPVVATLLGR